MQAVGRHSEALVQTLDVLAYGIPARAVRNVDAERDWSRLL